jgi:hypothetical protein
VFLLVSALVPGGATAAEDAGLAFVLGAGSYVRLGAERVALPVGSRIELSVDGRPSGGRFAVQVSPGGLAMPAIDLVKDARRLRVRISQTAAGWLTPGEDGVALELNATVEVELGDGAAVRTDTYALALTTGTPGAAPAEAGDAVHYTSRSARLVAASTVAADSPIAPGEPLVVVLDGTFEGLPAGLR